MGKISIAMNHYLSDNRRFADLFNGAFFYGETVVNAEELSGTTEVYRETLAEDAHTGEREERKERIRDICKVLRSGEILRILALENQEWVDYAMPFRCMQYDTMEYSKQIDRLRKSNRKDGVLKTETEKFCGLRKEDRIVPVYTLCLYHGTEKWDGPRSLRDMMRFGTEKDCFQEMFNDYPLRLYCLNEAKDFNFFHTEIGTLFRAMQYRKDKAALRKLLQERPEYQQLDVDTLEAMSVMLEMPSIWKKREKYMTKMENGEEEYNMCQAVREWAEEERNIGREEGMIQGIEQGIILALRNLMESTGMALEQAMDVLKLSLEDRDRYMVKIGR